MYYKIAQLILTPGTQSTQLGEVYLAQPDAHKEGLAGRLFILIELPANAAGGARFINFLVNELTQNYYQNEKLILRERLSTIKIEHIFEAALAKTNKKLADFLQSPSLDLNLNHINATVGVIFENEIHFSVIGANKAFLIYLNPKSQTGADYRLTEITERAAGEPATPVAANKVFSNVINGQLPQGGYFIFSNEALPEYLTQKQLADIITTLSPASAVEQIKNLLGQVNAYVSFLGLVIKNTVGQAPSREERTVLVGSSQTSINTLNYTEEATERLLTPSGLIDFKSWLSKLARLRPSFAWGRVPESRTGQLMMTERMTVKKKVRLAWIGRAGRSLAGGLMQLVRLFYYLPRLLKPGAWRTWPAAARARLGKLFAWLAALERKHQLIIGIVVISLGLFLYNILTLNQRNQEAALALAREQAAKAVEQKETAVESNLLYQNEQGANQLLAEIKPLLAQLPRDDAKYQELFRKYDDQAARLRRETKAEPRELVNFTELDQAARPDNLVFSNNKLYAAESGRQTVFQYDLANKTGTSLANLADNLSELRLPSLVDGQIYYLAGPAVLALDTETGTAKRYNLDLVGDPNNLGGAVVYNNRLYLLSRSDQQIYRYSRVGSSFTNGTPWLREKDPFLAQGASLAVETSIFALSQSGQGKRYLRGAAESFGLAPVLPALESAQKLLLAADKLYVFDPANKRLVGFDKSGKFLNQISFEGLNDLKDASLSPDGKKAYLLAGSQAWEINL